MKDGRRKTEDGKYAEDGRLDLAIDAAVREMLDVEPRADLRERVVASAFRRNRTKPVASAFRRNVVASGFSRNRVVWAAAAALILLAVFVARRGGPVAPQAPIVARGVDVRLPALPPVAPQRVVAVAPAPVRTAPRLGGTVVAASYTADDRDVADIAPLERIAPIRIAPIAQDSIAPADMTMTPLKAIADVQVAPLTPPDGRH